MSTVAFDTSTAATVVAVDSGGTILSRRLEPPAGGRPGHSAQLLEGLESLLAGAGISWDEVGTIGVGAGPGSFTGLRISAATAEGLRRATGARVVAVDSLEALALPALRACGGRPVCAVIDARRGELFAAGWAAEGDRIFGPVAVGPEAIDGVLAGRPWVVAGEVPEGFASGAGSDVADWPEPADPLNLIAGEALCELASRGPATTGPVVPEYVRAPDAERPGR